jgi:hypothetical protein
MRAATALLVCSLAAASTAGCGDADGGSAPFPGTILYKDPIGAFEFRLLQPPWLPPFRYVYTDLQLDMTFSIVPPIDATITTDVEVLLAEALYSLQFSKVTGDPATAMAAVKGTIPGGGAAVPAFPVSTVEGSTGVEMAWQEKPTVFHRDAFLASPGTATFRLHFTAQKEIADDNMIGQMISSFLAK